MAAEHHGVSADLPDVLMGQFLQWKQDRGYGTDSQALIALVELFFAHQPLVKESRIQKLEQEVAQLKEVIQMGRGMITDRMDLLQAQILRLEGRSQSAPVADAVDFDDLPDDEPDEILTDFLESGGH